MSECVLKTLACRGLRVGPSKVVPTVAVTVAALSYLLMQFEPGKVYPLRSLYSYSFNFRGVN